ncbi:conserved repeat domain protein [Bacillus cereus 03BB108]|nr:conserved repeat domain protein [Bacillus cereus 03BB108]
MTINSIAQPGINPSGGIQVGTIAAGSTSTVTFQVQVNSLPTSGVIRNVGNVTFTYQPDPTKPAITTTNPTPPTTVPVNTAITNPIKTADKTAVDIGDTITYTVTFNNDGTIPSTNVIFTDTIPAGTTFIPNSVVLNNASVPNSNPATGISVGTINPGETKTLSFQVLVTQVPGGGVITNEASTTYTYQPDPNLPPVTTTEPTTPTTVAVNTATVNPTKSANQAFVDIGDIITYTISLQNNGTVPATNVILTDPIPNGTSFIQNSVIVGGVLQPNANPANGILIGTLNPNQATTITFQVRVISVPPNGIIQNQGTVSSTYVVNPSEPPVTKITPTPITETHVDTVIVTPTKSANRQFVDIGDTITYTVTFQNLGTVPATNVTLTDPIPPGAAFITNSVTINGVPTPGENPELGISFGTVNVGETITVTYQVTVTSLPPDGTIRNQASFTYQYQPNPSEPPVTTTTTTPNVNIPINNPNPTTTKSVDRQIADLGDTITFTVTFQNRGTVPATNVIVKDILLSGVSFVPGSVVVNGTSQPGENPEIGIPVGTVNPGQSITVTFQGVVNSIPPGGVIRNQANITFTYEPNPNEPSVTTTITTPETETAVNTATLNPQKTADRSFVALNDTITYTLSFQNTGTVPATNITVMDSIPAGTTFVPDSVTINGIPQPGTNPALGISLGTLAPSERATITFQVRVVNIPASGEIRNQGSATFNYQPDPNLPPVTKTETTPETTTPIQTVVISPTKTANLTFAEIGDNVTYTVTFTNQGTIPATGVTITDSLPPSTTFVTNSVTVNTIPQPGVSPISGISVGTVNPGETVTVTFQVQINAIPPNGKIENTASVTYISQPTPGEPPITTTETTPTVTLPVRTANPDTQKTVDREFASIGDTLTYTITLQNNGNIPATDVIITDSIPTGTTFIPGSVTINGISQPNLTPTTGIPVGTLNPRQIVTVTLEVQVTALPPNGIISNEANVTYTSQPDPTLPPITTTTPTPIAETIVQNAELESTKTVDLPVANIGDALTYTITLENIGNIPMTNVSVIDPPPVGTQFIVDSVTVNSISQPGIDPSIGIPIGTIQPNQIVTITFQVTITNIPPNGVVTNVGSVNFTSQPNPNEPPVTETETTPPVNTEIINSIINPSKTADRNNVDIGDIITYTVTFQNLQTVELTNIIFTDSIPIGTTFIPNSVTINGIPTSDVDPALGIPLGTLNPSQSVVVTFQVRVVSIPPNGIIVNEATITYTFQPNPGEPPVTVTTPTPPTTTNVNTATTSPTKSADKAFALLGDTITYTISLQNTGTVPATNVLVTDPIPAGTTFIPNSVTINDVTQPGIVPSSGILIGTLEPNTSAVVTFQVQVTSIPPTGFIENEGSVSFQYQPDPNSPPVSVTTPTPTTKTQVSEVTTNPNKQATPQVINLGDTVTYTITFQNVGNINASDVIIADPTPAGTTFIPNSVTINGVASPGANPNSGVNVGIVTPGQIVTLTYQVTVTALPPDGIIKNTATVTYTFQPNPSEPPITITDPTPTVEVSVITPTPNPNKLADKQIVDINEIITYTVTFQNRGSVPATSVIITDPLANGLTFVPGTVIINGILDLGANPVEGIPVGTVNPNDTITVQFQARVTSVPPGGIVRNQATVTFTYEPIPGEPPITITDPTPINTTDVNTAILNPQKTATPETVTLGDIITYTISLQNTGTIPANNILVSDPIPTGTSFIQNSVTINNVSQPTANPETGIQIPTLSPSESATISFRVLVTSIPPSGEIQNQGNVSFQYQPDATKPPVSVTTPTPTTITPVNVGTINPIKTADKSIVSVGDTITFTITFQNEGTIPVTDISVTDSLPAGTSFIPNSVTINNIPVPNANPSTGILVGTLNPLDSVTISFQVQVITLPPNRMITNIASITSTSQPDPTRPPVTTTITTPPITVEVNPNEPNTFIKTANVNSAHLGDFITYTLTFTNNGAISANNVLITDPLPPEVTFYPNSVTVNGVARPGTNPTIGILIDTVNPGESVVIRFIVQVTAEPRDGLIRNTARIRYTLRPDPTQPPISVDETSEPNIIPFIGPFVSPNLTCFFDGTRFIRRGWDRRC